MLIFVTKFPNNHLAGDESLRDKYFRALRHNIVVNVDDLRVVDNPKAIAERLVQETLGSAHDFEGLEFVAGDTAGIGSGSA